MKLLIDFVKFRFIDVENLNIVIKWPMTFSMNIKNTYNLNIKRISRLKAIHCKKIKNLYTYKFKYLYPKLLWQKDYKLWIIHESKLFTNFFYSPEQNLRLFIQSLNSIIQIIKKIISYNIIWESKYQTYFQI